MIPGVGSTGGGNDRGVSYGPKEVLIRMIDEIRIQISYHEGRLEHHEGCLNAYKNVLQMLDNKL
jgi:hypothetical protein